MSAQRPGLVISAVIHMAPEDVRQAIELSKIVVQKTRGEKGCLFYAYSTDILDENLIRIVEGWTDEAALQAHLATPHVAEFLAGMNKLKMLSISAMKYGVSTMADMMAPQS